MAQERLLPVATPHCPDAADRPRPDTADPRRPETVSRRLVVGFHRPLVVGLHRPVVVGPLRPEPGAAGADPPAAPLLLPRAPAVACHLVAGVRDAPCPDPPREHATAAHPAQCAGGGRHHYDCPRGRSGPRCASCAVWSGGAQAALPCGAAPAPGADPRPRGRPRPYPGSSARGLHRSRCAGCAQLSHTPRLQRRSAPSSRQAQRPGSPVGER